MLAESALGAAVVDDGVDTAVVEDLLELAHQLVTHVAARLGVDEDDEAFTAHLGSAHTDMDDVGGRTRIGRERQPGLLLRQQPQYQQEQGAPR